ncbi:S-acyl fatty acid synthase thioesterase [Nadsonia fulvescens var. elongata DSM 6958]|uniref:Fatty acid synthase subunit beta n=2 Tax=Nadsonia fulvescens TaxID=45786 RepID=A0A1E3PLT4_9ASCO|nr:S-acyl fatty acid synthase thioesterase [Nadsonia fulvescens var. elongata DSM 6958]
MSTQTGVSSPQTASTMRPLVISYGSIEQILLIPSSLLFNATQLRDLFIISLPAATEDRGGDDEPASAAELLAALLGFAASLVQSQPGPYDEVLTLILNEFESGYLQGNDVHAYAAALHADAEIPTTVEKVKSVIKSYYAARIAANRPMKNHDSALFRASQSDDSPASIYAIFGGQGNTEDYFEELRELYSVYDTLIADFISLAADKLLTLSREHPAASKIYTKGLDIAQWLDHPETTPDLDYLISAPVSVPVIGVIQLAHYVVTARVLGKTPGELRASLNGSTGHSQGLVNAVAIATADTWESFFEAAIKALTVFFCIGVRVQEKYPNTSLTPQILEDSVAEGEGKPTPMLSVSNLSRKQLETFIDATNRHLPKEKHIVISLVNGPRNLVVTGPPQSLYGLNLALRKAKAVTGLDQNRVPHTQRKLKFSNRFLPITSPFHSYLLDCSEVIINDLKTAGVEFKASDLTIPVFDTFDGSDFRQQSGSIVARLVNLITHLPVNWELATEFESTHIVDFGPGGISGLGVLTQKNKDGSGVRIILAGVIDGSASQEEFGYKQELFDREEKAVKYAPNWLKEHSPKLVRSTSGEKTYVDTKFSRLLGKAPIMVAGMTPTTVSPSFVSATMNAGYHIELAGGGYFNPNRLTDALETIEKNVQPGTGITINLIYVNPVMMQWAIPLIAELRAKGFPIQGMTIGAGVPSIEVANEYIQNLSLKHISFKPGSIDAISGVIAIAKANPTFPIILQWTGGRGGGHHSYEDFHAPILQMYARIRRCSNIVLVAGSGFGGAEDSYPYITGEWSTKFAYPPMPFDGILFGSRAMTALEAATSLDAKQAIVDAPGVLDHEWENTYKKPTGGIVTVLSEMGEPIHKLATRGVLFWQEMDNTIFNLTKDKRLAALKQKKDYIIKRLNADSQKTWFGKNAQGEVVDLDDMTYAEIVARMIELMYVAKENRWIDPTLRNLTGTFIRRLEERLTTKEGQKSILQSFADLDNNPQEVLARVVKAYPAASTQIVNAHDRDFFLTCTRSRTQKPVPFVPVLDEHFDFYFKKDSLWQSEDLAAVVGEDVGRTCILQGPVAVSYATKVNEPIKEILDNVHDGHVAALTKKIYGGDASKIPEVEFFGGKAPRAVADVETSSVVSTEVDKDTVIYTIDSAANADALPSTDSWMELLGGETYSWRHALFSNDVIVQGTKIESNPLRSVLAPVAGLRVQVAHATDAAKSVISAFETINGKPVKTVQISKSGDVINVKLIDERNCSKAPLALDLLYTYKPECGVAPIQEIMNDRNDRIKAFYWKLWFGDEPFSLDIDVRKTFEGGEAVINAEDIADFVHAVGNKGEAFVPRNGKETLAPMDFAIVVGWKAIMKAIFPKTIDGDLLKLVHLSNGFKMLPGAAPLKMGDVVNTTAEVRSVINQTNGKTVEVCGTITRAGVPVMEVTSQFFFRGEYRDFENTFQIKDEAPMQMSLETPKDVAVLLSKEWFHYDGEGDAETELLGKTLTFRLKSHITFLNTTAFGSVVTTGSVLLDLPTKEIRQVASVNYEAGRSFGNPVIDYLERNGSTIELPINFENAIPLTTAGTELNLRAPTTNEPYAVVSGDYNPIHVSRVFSTYAKLKGTITHGMYSSAAVRSLVEIWAAENVISRVRAFNCSFTGMVLPNDDLQVKLEHVGMINGRKIIKVQANNVETGETVLVGEAEVEQPTSTFVFTGQGSQEQGMGMDLYESSPVAKEVWDRADIHFLNNYGFSIIQIVKTNPKELTIHFGGAKGNAIRANYISMMFETIDAEGNLISEKIFKEIDESTDSYTFINPTGLLSATQFTQPALTLMEKASFEDMRSKGLVPSDVSFAGHSLGEYSALASLGEVMPIESLVDVVFYRGMTMQVAVPRDSLGRSNYGMCAVNPSRISKTFDDAALRFVIDHISEQTGWLLEIVNYNVENTQYVTAGDLRGLDTLTNVLNFLKVQKIDIDQLLKSLSIEKVKEHLVEIVEEISKKSVEKPQPIDLERGFAVIPLKGISVPFHSSYLRNGVKPFQRFLVKKIPKAAVKPANLIGKYIPNLTARPFEITKEYFQEVYELTKSDKIKAILDNWESYESK